MRDPGLLGVVCLEDEHLVRPHVGMIPPPLARALCLTASPSNELQYPLAVLGAVEHGIRDMDVSWRQVPGVAHGPRELFSAPESLQRSPKRSTPVPLTSTWSAPVTPWMRSWISF
ncbi:hypothetical protein diail_12072 [Diaporthe ilicicola]|nr:hypothetical protein diail_12072 [Diaporthe ilicicola]